MAGVIGVAVSNEAWPFIVGAALVILILLFAVALLITHRRRVSPRTAPDPAVEIGESDAVAVEPTVGAQDEPRGPEDQRPEPAVEPPGQEVAPAVSETTREPQANAEPRPEPHPRKTALESFTERLQQRPAIAIAAALVLLLLLRSARRRTP